MKTVFIAFFVLLTLPVWAGWKEEEAKINYLITEVSKVEGSFVRNGSEYGPEKAAAHLRMKWKRAMNSWFAPDRSEWTAALFIEKVASSSSLSGKPYQIKDKNSQAIDAKTWLLKKLQEYPASPNR